MDRSTSPIEPLGRFAPYTEPTDSAPWHRSVRARLFAVTFGLTLALGVGWTLLQPVVYRSAATVLMSAPSAIDAKNEKANVQSVAIQRRILLGSEVTQELLSSLHKNAVDGVDLQYLRDVLRVKGVSDTNLVEMIAEGEDEDILPVLVDSWIEVYLDIRADEIKQSQRQTLGVVEDQLSELALKLDKARDALAAYRSENNITSVDRQQNEELSRLNGLNTALNLAVKTEVKAKADLDSLRQAIAAGKDVVPPSERLGIETMESELMQLQMRMVKLNKKYTQNYVRNQPGIREIPVRIAELEVLLATEKTRGETMMLTNAEQAHAAALQSVNELQQRLNEQEKAAAEFTTVYAKHQALAKDLAELETLNRETQSRLTQVQVNQVEKYPQVSVINRPDSESERIGPDYLLYLGSSLAAALGAGILSVWLYGFLGPRPTAPAYVTLSGVHMYPQDVNAQLGYSAPTEQRIGKSDTRLITDAAADKSSISPPDDEPENGDTLEGEKTR